MRMLQRQSAPFETIEASYKSFLLGLPIVGAEIEVGINRVGSFVGPTIERAENREGFQYSVTWGYKVGPKLRWGYKVWSNSSDTR